MFQKSNKEKIGKRLKRIKEDVLLLREFVRDDTCDKAQKCASSINAKFTVVERLSSKLGLLEDSPILKHNSSSRQYLNNIIVLLEQIKQLETGRINKEYSLKLKKERKESILGFIEIFLAELEKELLLSDDIRIYQELAKEARSITLFQMITKKNGVITRGTDAGFLKAHIENTEKQFQVPIFKKNNYQRRKNDVFIILWKLDDERGMISSYGASAVDFAGRSGEMHAFVSHGNYETVRTAYETIVNNPKNLKVFVGIVFPWENKPVANKDTDEVDITTEMNHLYLKEKDSPVVIHWNIKKNKKEVLKAGELPEEDRFL